MNEPHNTERRVAVRWHSSQQAPCHFATIDRIATRWAVVLNVSQQGIGLEFPCDLTAGTELIVELPSKDYANPQAIIAHVIYAKLISPGSWSIGCHFVRPLHQDELDTLL